MPPFTSILDLTFLPVPARPFESVFLVYSPNAPHSLPQSAAVAGIGLGAWLLRLEPKNVVMRLAGGKIQPVPALAMRMPDALSALAMMQVSAPMPGVRPTGRAAPQSVKAWAQAAKLALELCGREQIVPTIRLDDRRVPRAVWAVPLQRPADRERRNQLADSLPPSAWTTFADSTSRPPRSFSPSSLIDAFLDAAADSLVRQVSAGAQRSRASRAAAAEGGGPWETRLIRALTSRDNALQPGSHAEAGLAAGVSAWASPLLGAASQPLRVNLTLVAPETDGPESPWRVEYALQPTAELHAAHEAANAAEGEHVEAARLIPAAEVWATKNQALMIGDKRYDGAEEILLRGLAEAGRIVPAIERSLHARAPGGALLTTAEAWDFLSRITPILAQAGFGLVVPTGLEDASRKRLRARLRIGAPMAQIDAAEAPDDPSRATGAAGTGALDLKALAEYHWEIALGDDTLSPEEFRAISEMQAPLVRWRGSWVAVDPKDLERSRELLNNPGGALSGGTALAAIVTGEMELFPGEPVEVVADGDLAGIATWLRSTAAGVETQEPAGFLGTLRPYQRRGLGWLAAMEAHGIGSCLADDMGLGKTVQVIALMLHRPRPSLLICPTSVVGNWERELARFAPQIPVLRHHGQLRAKNASELMGTVSKNGVVVTTYALARRDEKLLASIPWQRIVLDEAQSIKNAQARQSKAVRALLSNATGISFASVSRIALTGTPVENRLSELWSILDFLNPGLLGTMDNFRRRYAIPIERWQDEAVATRLKRLVQPFVLRRLKSDPAVASSLPEKNEMSVVCTLTREQATMYQAQVDAAMEGIANVQGVKRRGRILALITALKQICNHPSQFLKDDSSLAGRSGKLARLTEMTEEVLLSGAKALIFTQFRQMGDRIVKALTEQFGEEPIWLHGGVPALERDAMVERFQSPDGPKLFVLSLKAGGFGLNLTAATNVFHFDRWWNPAVEDQATNRAHRIGQTKNVSVFKLITAGTLEERIDKLLESKRGLADRVLGAGETWLTEMTDDDLRLLVSLGPDAEVEADEDGSETADLDEGILP